MKQRIVGSYLNFIWNFFVPSYSIFNNQAIEKLSASTFYLYLSSITNLLLFGLGFILLMIWAVKGKNSFLSRACVLSIVLLIPLISNTTYFISCVSHMVTRYPFYLWYLLVIVLLRWAKDQIDFKKCTRLRCLAFVLTLFLLLSNVRFSNEIYTKKDLETKSTLSTMTRVISRIEEQENFVPNETPVVFIGKPAVQSGVAHMKKYVPLQTGISYDSSITYYQAYHSYCSTVLQYELKICDEETAKEFARKYAVKEMPVFPAKGSIQTVDGVIVVKMGEVMAK